MSKTLALVEAVKSGDQERLARLLRSGVSARSKDADRTPALVWAARLGNQTALEALLAADPMCAKDRDARGRNAMLRAAEAGQEGCVRRLLGFGWARVKDQQGVSALMLAAASGSAGCVRALLPGGSAWDRDKDGMSALMHASAADAGECVEALLPASDLAEKVERGRDALAIACEKNAARAVGAFIQHAGFTRHELWQGLKSAARRGAIDCVRALIPVTDAGQCNEEGSALQQAAQGGNVECLKELLPLSDPRAGSNLALIYALISWRHECADLLIPGSDPLIPFNEGMTPLMWALRCGSPKNVADLIPRSDMSARDKQGFTPLLWIIHLNSEKHLDAVFQASDPHQLGPKGESLMQFALDAIKSHANDGGRMVKLLEVLLEARALQEGIPSGVGVVPGKRRPSL